MIDGLASNFDAERDRLRSIAFRLLGSLTEAEDAVQEAWIRLASVDATTINNLRAWLTTVVSRLCLDILRTRKSRREEGLIIEDVEKVLSRDQQINPEQEAMLTEAVGIGLMVVLDRLEPPERIAFVLHDIFGVGFADIALIVGRSEVAARQLSSRARRRLRGSSHDGAASGQHQRQIVEAFFAASRAGDFTALLALLDPEAILAVDPEDPSAQPIITKGAAVIAKRAQIGAAARKRWSELVLVNGDVAILVAPFGQARLIMQFRVMNRRIGAIDVVTNHARLASLQISLLDQQGPTRNIPTCYVGHFGGQG